MIFLVAILGSASAIAVNGLADNLLRDDEVPLGETLIPRCGYCDGPRKMTDWSAIVSALFFSGACRRCGAPRPFRDLLVDSLLWIGFPVLWMLYESDLHALLIGGWILSVCILFSVIDIEHRAVIVEVVALVSLAILLESWTSGTASLLRALGGGLAGFLIFLLLFLLGKFLGAVFGLGLDAEPLGFGDVILAALIGCITGWPGILLAVFLSIFLGGLFGLAFAVYTIAKRSPLQTATMAYGPYLLIAGLVTYFFGTPFLGGILTLFPGR